MKKESKSYFFRIVKRTYVDNSFMFFVQKKEKAKKIKVAEYAFPISAPELKVDFGMTLASETESDHIATEQQIQTTNSHKRHRGSGAIMNNKWEELPYPYDTLVAAKNFIEMKIKLDTPKKVLKDEIL